MRFISWSLFVFLFSCSAFAQDVSIIPNPVHVLNKSGNFVITKYTTLVARSIDDRRSAIFFNNYLERYYGFRLPLGTHAAANSIQMSTRYAEGEAKNGAYILESSPKGVRITGETGAGTFYGMQTLIQLLPIQKSQFLKIPCVIINDSPRFSYRGMLLDVSRYFYSVDFIKEFLDFMALHKMNYFQWHLTDDPGWRIEIKRYPRLTSIGAWRTKKDIFQFTDTAAGNERYGGYYTQAQIRDIVKYAQDRYITIVPEIEMPAHCLSALVSYPELGCTGGAYKMPTYWYPNKEIFCAGNDRSFEFLENVLDEVMGLFQSPYIHIGGDECPKDRWIACPKCQKRMQEEHLTNENELQSYFVKRIEKYVNRKGRTIIGWDEILEGGLAPNAIVMSWHGDSGAIKAAKSGHQVIMAPTEFCYFDYPQKDDVKNMPDWMRVTTVQRVYSFDPIPKMLSRKESHYVLGGQGNVWTELISTPQKVEYMIFPRMSALSEVLWSPKRERDFNNFKTRMETQFKRYDLWGVSYCEEMFDSSMASTTACETNNLSHLDH